MAKYYGKVGYVVTSETAPGVWSEEVIERECYGDFERNYRRNQTSADTIIQTPNLDSFISIVADDFAMENWPFIRYVEWKGVRWNVNSIEDRYPRLMLTLGGAYNGPQA